MKVSLKDLQELLQSIDSKLGTWGIILFLTVIIVVFLASIYYKYYVKAIAEENSKKAIEEFKNQLSKNIQTQMGLFFRDENVRNNLLSTIGQKSFEKKIECWQFIQAQYFKYQKTWNFDSSTDIKEYTDIDNDLSDLRIKIFNETIYLGYDLSPKLLRLNSLMREGLRQKKTELAYSGNNYQLHLETKLQNNLDQQHDVEQKIIELLYDVEKWIIDKLHSDQTIDKFEFTSQQLEVIKAERLKQFETISA